MARRKGPLLELSGLISQLPLIPRGRAAASIDPPTSHGPSAIGFEFQTTLAPAPFLPLNAPQSSRVELPQANPIPSA